MPTWIHRLATAVPEHSYSQAWSADLMQTHVEGRPATRRILRSIYRNSGIETRHSVVHDLHPEAATRLFVEEDGTRRPTPGTGERNDVYAREARVLFENVARRLLEGDHGFEASDVTHVVTVSCTGFFAPGPDYHIVRALGLPGTTQRYHVGFMGCYAAFQGLRMADAFCRADPDAVVLVVAAELCSLHLQFSDDTDDLIAGAVFADGAGGALVSAREPQGSGAALEITAFHGDLVPEGEGDMAWTIGDTGFRMKLSTYVPELIEANLAPVLGALLGRTGVAPEQVAWWAVHPGGRAIVDRVQETLELSDDQVAASRGVLRDFGNMSSPTVLFVLESMLSGRGGVPRGAPGDRIFAMAFGPGLTIEAGMLRVHAGA
jgi:predicted naringenin-chalcone synthase